MQDVSKEEVPEKHPAYKKAVSSVTVKYVSADDEEEAHEDDIFMSAFPS